MFENKSTIIFDMDGTLIDSVGVWNQVDLQLIQTLAGLPWQRAMSSREESVF